VSHIYCAFLYAFRMEMSDSMLFSTHLSSAAPQAQLEQCGTLIED
jgi:hypothetical protein